MCLTNVKLFFFFFPRKDIIIINQFLLIYIFTKASLLNDPLAAEYYS